jgi:acyl-CoA dehydrogenase
MSDMREEMLRTLDRIAEDTVTAAVRQALDVRVSDASAGLAAKRLPALGEIPLWQALEAAGITALGGAGGDDDVTFPDAMALVHRAAFHALAVPIGETIIARRIVRRHGLGDAEATTTLVPPAAARDARLSEGRLTGRARGVPWGRGVGRAIVAASGASSSRLVLADVSAAGAGEGANMAGEPRDDVDLGRARVLSSVAVEDAARMLETEGALLRAVQMAGAASSALDHCLRWVGERVQFGKPIAKHQAVQQLMAQLASEVAAAGAAVDLAVDASHEQAARFETAIAKARAGEAAGKVATISHGVFGAMGFTREHPLHYATRRLWSWRNEFGGEAYWQADIGRAVVANGGKALWAKLTERE